MRETSPKHYTTSLSRGSLAAKLAWKTRRANQAQAAAAASRAAKLAWKTRRANQAKWAAEI